MRLYRVYADASKDRANDCSPATTYSEHVQAVRACAQALAREPGWLQPAQAHGCVTGWPRRQRSPQAGTGPEKVAEWIR